MAAAKKAKKKALKSSSKKAVKKPAPKKHAAPKIESVQKEYYHYPARSEAEQMRALSEDLQDAYAKLRGLFTSFGEQRIYTSAKAIMFARKTCHAFVRPKRSYLELVFFLREPLESDLLKKVESFSKNKSAHMFQLKHADQVESPLSEWLEEAFAQSA